MANQDLIVPVFRMHTSPNEIASKAAGRPIFDELEVCEIRFGGDRQRVGVFPAHDPEPNATREAGEPVSYAMVYNEQYRRFKAQEAQEVAGTPLSELPFLTQAKRLELKALNIHTAEALASLDGTPLKQLGMGGREMKEQAQAYLDNANGSADVTAMAAEIAALKQQLADRDDVIENYATRAQKTKYQKAVERSVREDEAESDEEATPQRPVDPTDERPTHELEDWTNEELKDWLRGRGLDVRGNPSHETLVGRVRAAQVEDAA